MKFWIKSFVVLEISLTLCSCKTHFEKQDIVGDWKSDDKHYVLHLFDNDSCVISNLPKNEFEDFWIDEDNRNDTTHVDIHGTWEILDPEDIHDIFINAVQYGASWSLRINTGIFFSRKKAWKLYYTTMDEREYVEEHTFSRCDN